MPREKQYHLNEGFINPVTLAVAIAALPIFGVILIADEFRDHKALRTKKEIKETRTLWNTVNNTIAYLEEKGDFQFEDIPKMSVEDAVETARDSIRRGETLAAPLEKFWVFPPMVVRMIDIGEKSGALEQLLEKIAEFYDDEVSATVEGLTSMIEPIMIAVMGGMVGSIVMAIFLPIIALQDSLTKG